MKYTAQNIIATATKEEVAALEGYFGPDWVYRVRKDEETKPRHGLAYESPTPELYASKRAAREAWEAIKRDISLLEDAMALAGTMSGAEPETSQDTPPGPFAGQRFTCGHCRQRCSVVREVLNGPDKGAKWCLPCVEAFQAFQRRRWPNVE